MKFEKEKTCRGFALYKFRDNYGKECSLQESSAVEPHIWLGISKTEAQIMYKDSQKLGLNLQKKYPETNECGWCDYPIPEEVMVTTRMHLNRKQAKTLAKKLLKFARSGRLK